MMMAGTAAAQDFSYNEHTKGKGIETFTERVALEISTVSTRIAEERPAILPVVGALAGPLIDVGLSVVKANIDRRAKQYVAGYTCANSGDRFYHSRDEVNLPALTIRRTVTLAGPSGSAGVATTDALVVVLEPELSFDKHAFRYRVRSVAMRYAKARTKGRFDYLDVQLDVVFRSLVTEGKQEAMNLRAFSFVIPSVMPNAPYETTNLPATPWLPFPPPFQATKGAPVYDGTGLYEFFIGITESNPYKVRAENKQYIVEKSRDSWSALAAEIGEVIRDQEKK